MHLNCTPLYISEYGQLQPFPDPPLTPQFQEQPVPDFEPSTPEFQPSQDTAQLATEDAAQQAAAQQTAAQEAAAQEAVQGANKKMDPLPDISTLF